MTEAKESKSGKITKDMPIAKIVGEHPETFEVFMRNGMHCVGCAAARFENLEQGCEAHGIDADKLVKELNEAVEKGKK
jgi:hybrid cluster-associated redox disulfide protein